MTQPKVVEEQLDLTNVDLLGNSTATTQASGNNSTRIATTAFVKNQNYASTTSPSFTGTPTAPTQTTGDNSTRLATTAFVQDAVATAGAGAAFGDIGTYAFAMNLINAAAIVEGTVRAGSELRPTNATGSHFGVFLTGSWRCMGHAYTNGGTADRITLWLRIS